MNCTRYERWLWDDLEGRLSVAQAQELRQHLQACPHCQRRWEAAQVTYQALRTLPRRRAPEHLTQQVWARVQEASARKPAFAWWKRVALAPALGVLAAAAWWGWLAVNSEHGGVSGTATASQNADNWVEIHEQLEVADWSPTPTPSYFITTGYTR
ncbi:MAG: zf-HC2 domain-containing protein [Fimbriimonadales bacterium]|nr:zf-HC2 domain-containing protein [Fimbriimonadales bacterium]